VLVFSVSIVAANSGGHDFIPSGPWHQPNQPVSLSSLLQPEDVEQQLFEIEKRSKGRMEVELIGHSAGHEWPIYVAKFGEPDEDKARILIDTQIHGNEPLGTEAAMELIKTLAQSGNSEARKILDNVTVWIVPMLNMDGATIYQREPDDEGRYGGDSQSRTNIQGWDPLEWGLPEDTGAPWYWNPDPDREDRHQGYDINRDSHPHLSFCLSEHEDHGHIPPGHGSEPGFLVTPEARAMRDVFVELQPDLYINHHHRGCERTQTWKVSEEDDARMFTLQILAQVVPLDQEYTIEIDGEAHSYSLSEESLDLSKQVNALVYQKLQERGNSPFGAVTQYSVVKDYYGGYGLPGTTLGSYSLNDAAIMLYETRWTGQLASGRYIKQSYIGLYETLLGFATGEVHDIDPAYYDDEVPPVGPSVQERHPNEGF